MTNERAEIGIIGGSGLYSFFEGEEIEVRTGFGLPSDKIILGNLLGKKIAFLPRHGKKHQFSPHQIPYRANIAALNQLGVKRIIAPAAVGSLRREIKPGDFVICDQFVDRTKRRKDTFFDGPGVTHIETAYPYCPELRRIALAQAKEMELPFHSKGTVVVIEGPRFSTLSESSWFSRMGWDLVNMTQYPEVVLAAEMGICYLNVSLVTDYDVGIYAEEEMKPVSIEEVIKNFSQNTEKLKNFISAVVEALPEERNCDCRAKSDRARLPSL